jgi:hypothetical protein
MLLTGDVLENLRVERLVGGFPRSPLQRNGLGESDAELVRIPGTSLLLAISSRPPATSPRWERTPSEFC